MRIVLAVLSLTSLVYAADQTILGKQLLVKDPQPGIDATKRKIVGQGKETASPNTVVGDPTATGATLTVYADGTTAGSQTYTLPAALWTAINGGFKYTDPQLTLGPVKMAKIKAVNGTFEVQAKVSGKTGGISVVPPNLGGEGCLLLNLDPTLAGTGDRYHVRFPPAPSSTITKNDAKAFVIKDATVEGVCPQACSPGAPGCGWSDGDIRTYDEGTWGDIPTPTNIAGLLQHNYPTVYASVFGEFDIGIPGPSGYSAAFTDVDALLFYLPAAGQVGPLDSDLLNPLQTSSGAFGGEVSALKLNVDFADAGLILGTSALRFGDLTLCGLSGVSALNGTNVRSFLATVQTLLGGGTAAYTIADLYPLTAQLNASFDSGSAGTFAQDHLVNGACP